MADDLQLNNAATPSLTDNPEPGPRSTQGYRSLDGAQSLPSGLQAKQKLLDSGVPPDEADKWAADQQQRMLDTGAPAADVAKLWTKPEPDFSKALALVDAASHQDPNAPHVASSVLEKLQAGWGQSNIGMAASGNKPAFVAPEHAGIMSDILVGAGTMAGDLPSMMVGGVLGGLAGAAVPGAGETGVSEAVGLGAGMNALPTAIREVLVNHYKDPAGPFTWGDFSSQVASSFWNVTKAGVVGAGGGAAGRLVGFVGERAVGKAVGSLGELTGFAAGAATTQGIMDGKIPDADDFAAGIILALAAHGTVRAYGATKRILLTPKGQVGVDNLQDIYRGTGIPPQTAGKMATQDAAIQAEVLAPTDASGERHTPVLDQLALPDPKSNYRAKITAATESKYPDAPPVYGNQDQGNEASKVTEHPILLPSELVPQGHVDLVKDLPLPADQLEQYGYDPAKVASDPAYREIAQRTILADLNAEFKGRQDDTLVAYRNSVEYAKAWAATGRDPRSLNIETQHLLESADLRGITDGSVKAAQDARVLALQGLDEKDLPKNGEILPPPKAVTGGGGGGGKEPPIDGDIWTPGPDKGPKRLEPGHTYTAEELDEEILSHVKPRKERAWFNPVGVYSHVISIISAFSPQLRGARILDKKLGLNSNLKNPTNTGIEDMMRQTYASKERAGFFFRHGVLDPTDPREIRKTSDANWMSAFNAVREDGGTLDGFMAYRLARRHIELGTRGIDSGFLAKEGTPEERMTKAILRVKMAGEEAKYKRGLDMLRESKNGSIDYAQKSGLFSGETAERMKNENQEHIVLRRVVEPGYNPGPGRSFRSRIPVKKIEGSDLDVIDPMHTELDNLHTIIAMADRNRALGAIIDLVEKHNQKAGPEKQLPFKNVSQRFITSNVLDGELFDREGNPLPPKEKEAVSPFLAHRNLGHKMGESDFIYFRDGKAEVWHSDEPMLTQVLKEVRPDNPHPFFQVFIKFAGLQRAGITGALDFPFRAILHGQLASSAFSEGGSWMPYKDIYHNGFQSFWETYHQGPAYQRWVANGGAGSALVDLDINYIRSDIHKIFDDADSHPVWNAVNHPFEAFRHASHMVDAAARVGHFIRNEEKVGALKAGTLSRKAYLDYGEPSQSNFVQTWSRMVPFMPVGLKDIQQVLDAFRRDPGMALARGATVLTLPTVANFLANKEADQFLPIEQQYASLPQWMRDMYWVLPPVNGVRLKLKKPYVGGFLFATLQERFMEAMVMDNPRWHEDLAGAFKEQSMFPYMPSLVAPVLENWANKSLFTGRAIIKQSLEAASGYMQYNQGTSMVARGLARLLGPNEPQRNPYGMDVSDTSPLIIDNYIRQWGGTLPMQLLKLVEGRFHDPSEGGNRPSQLADIPWLGSFFVRHGGASQIIDDFYLTAHEIGTIHADQKQVQTNHGDRSVLHNSEEDKRVLRMKRAVTTQFSLIKGINDLPTITEREAADGTKGMTADEKTARVDSLMHSLVMNAKVMTDEMDKRLGRNPMPLNNWDEQGDYDERKNVADHFTPKRKSRAKKK